MVGVELKSVAPCYSLSSPGHRFLLLHMKRKNSGNRNVSKSQLAQANANRQTLLIYRLAHNNNNNINNNNAARSYCGLLSTFDLWQQKTR